MKRSLVIMSVTAAFMGCKSDLNEIAHKLSLQMWGFLTFASGTEKNLISSEYQLIRLYSYSENGTEVEIPMKGTNFSNFDPNNPIIILVHGYTDNKDRRNLVGLRKALQRNLNAQIIIGDWHEAASQIYFTAVKNTYPVGIQLGEFLFNMEMNNIDLSRVHLIGHSLGAHISGIAGQRVGGRVGRITGLDPAGPLFEFIGHKNDSISLDKSDAQFVDVIHSAIGAFGVVKPIGHADFYPNDGVVPQPGCSNLLMAVSCSHVRSIELFIASMDGQSEQFLAKNCTTWRHFQLANCTRDSLVPMGYQTPGITRGMFYLQTKHVSPYAQGNKFYKRSFVT